MLGAYLKLYLRHQINMKRENLHGWLIAAILTMFFCTAVSGQTSSGRTILEVYKSGFGMVAEGGKHLFVRVRDNGQIEYRESVIENNKQKYKLRKYNLSAEKLQELKDFLGNAQVELMTGEYGPDVPPLDHVIRFDIKIRRKTKFQAIKLINFDPNLRRADAPGHPRELIELVCRLKALHSRTGFRLLKNDCVLNKKETIESVVSIEK